MSRRNTPQRAGTVYLIHFEARHKHAGHYLGFATDLSQRMAQHRGGNGARLMEVIASAGIGWKVVRTWVGDRAFERRLKRRKNTPRWLCPVCRGEVPYDALDEVIVLPRNGNLGEGGRSVTAPPVPSDEPGDDPPF